MQLAEILAEFGQQSGMGNCTLDESGACRLVFDGRWAVDVRQVESSDAPPAFLLMASAGALPPESDARLLRRLLEANLFAHGPRDPFLALDTRGDKVMLLRRYELAGMDYPAFEMALTCFVDQVETWGGFLDCGGADPDAAPARPNDAPPDMLIRV